MPSSTSPEAQILYQKWQTHSRKKMMKRGLYILISLFIFLKLAQIAELDYGVLFLKIGKIKDYFSGLLPPLTWNNLAQDLGNWLWGWKLWLKLLWETLLMAYAGTFLGLLIGFPLCFFAARNVSPSRTHVFIARRLLELFRTVPEMVLALIFVFAFGIGSFAGILAIMCHTAGALGKLFAEVIENTEMKPITGLQAMGANYLQRIRFGVLPQVFPHFLTFILLRFEINVRSSTVLGVVGAGGLGYEMMNAIRQFETGDTSALLLLILITVMSMNALMAIFRRWLLGESRP